MPHADRAPVPLDCAVLTLSDTRTPATDRSGQAVCAALTQAGHTIAHYAVLQEEPAAIAAEVERLCGGPSPVAALILNGGTGIAPRDQTVEVVDRLLDKALPGFGELFRFLSYQKIGSRAMASRAIAGSRGQSLIFCLPGSTAAVRLALEALILPELVHLSGLLRSE